MQNKPPAGPERQKQSGSGRPLFRAGYRALFFISDPQSINTLVTVTTKSGMIPTQVKTMLNSGATSRDPALVVLMAKFTVSYSIIIRRQRQII